MNGGVETEEITTFPLKPYLLQVQQALPNSQPISVRCLQDTQHLRLTQPPDRFKRYSTSNRLRKCNADAKAEADTDANGILTKNSMSHSPCWANIINQLLYLFYLAKSTNSNKFSKLYCVSH